MNFDNNEFDYPIQRFEQMISSNEVVFFDASEFENIITYYMDTGRIGLAKRALIYGLEQHPDAINLRILQADIFIFEDKLKEAEVLLAEILEMEPRNEELYILMANVLSKKNKVEEAIQCLLKALSMTEDKEDVHHLIGMEYMNIESYNLAIEHLIKSISDEFPEDAAAIVNIVFCYEQENRIDEAKAFLNNYLDKKPYCEIAWHQLGVLYTNEGNLQEALNAFDYAIISDENFVGAIIEKAKIHEQLGQFPEAIRLYQQSLRLEDPTAFAYYKIAVCYLCMEEPHLAVKSLHKSVLEDPQMVKSWILLMDVSLLDKDLSKAYRYATKALNIDPYNRLVWISLFLIIQMMDVSMSHEYYQDILKSSNPFINFHDKFINSLSDFIMDYDSHSMLPVLKVAEICLISSPEYYKPIQLINKIFDSFDSLSDEELNEKLNELKELSFNHYFIFQSFIWQEFSKSQTIQLEEPDKMYEHIYHNYVTNSVQQNDASILLLKLFSNDLLNLEDLEVDFDGLDEFEDEFQDDFDEDEDDFEEGFSLN